jgi:hypothetical protein
MMDGQRYSFTERTDGLGQKLLMPYLPIILTNGNKALEVMALLDTGASVNVLPYDVGVQLGAIWENQTISVPLGGNLSHNEARGLLLSGIVAMFSPVELAFAWTQTPDVPVILGHMNFLAEFNVCFYRHELAFNIAPRSARM